MPVKVVEVSNKLHIFRHIFNTRPAKTTHIDSESPDTTQNQIQAQEIPKTLAGQI